MEGKVTVVAFHRAKPGKEQAFREALLAVCKSTRAEKGCINYDLHESLEARCPRVPRDTRAQGLAGRAPFNASISFLVRGSSPICNQFCA